MMRVATVCMAGMTVARVCRSDEGGRAVFAVDDARFGWTGLKLLALGLGRQGGLKGVVLELELGLSIPVGTGMTTRTEKSL